MDCIESAHNGKRTHNRLTSNVNTDHIDDTELIPTRPITRLVRHLNRYACLIIGFPLFGRNSVRRESFLVVCRWSSDGQTVSEWLRLCLQFARFAWHDYWSPGSAEVFSFFFLVTLENLRLSTNETFTGTGWLWLKTWWLRQLLSHFDAPHRDAYMFECYHCAPYR